MQDAKVDNLNLQWLKQAVAKGEGLHLEFKKKAKFPERIMKEISAFANTSGGYLILGVEDSGKITGLNNAEEEIFVITDTMEKWMHPIPDYSIRKITTGADNEAVVFSIIELTEKPCYVRSPAETGTYKGDAYYRVKDESVKISREFKEVLRGRASGKSFKFNFGDKEKVLLKHIEQKGSITLNSFIQLCSLNTKTASRTLVLLTLAGVLEISPGNEQDLFSLRT
jgi:predicted HTH transcriptional regulator